MPSTGRVGSHEAAGVLEHARADVDGVVGLQEVVRVVLFEVRDHPVDERARHEVRDDLLVAAHGEGAAVGDRAVDLDRAHRGLMSPAERPVHRYTRWPFARAAAIAAGVEAAIREPCSRIVPSMSMNMMRRRDGVIDEESRHPFSPVRLNSGVAVVTGPNVDASAR
jgi:hypothetical protein